MPVSDEERPNSRGEDNRNRAEAEGREMENETERVY